MMLEDYIAAWRVHDKDAILATLDADCVVIESYGPVYRGHERVEQWVKAWLAKGGRVLDWTIHDIQLLEDREFAEWTFDYLWHGEDKRLDGCTIAQLQDGKIAQLREYATTATLYDWHGEWRE